MKRNAKQLKKPFELSRYASQAGAIAGHKIAENPVLTGGSVAFAVVMFFVSTNALYYQPMAHKDAFFITRSMAKYHAPDLPKPTALAKQPEGKTDVFAITSESAAETQVAASDPTLLNVQSALSELRIYSGTIDGLSGPKTRAAIAKFQKQAGLEPTGVVDPLLIDAIRTASIPATKIPLPSKKEVLQEVSDGADNTAMTAGQIELIQAGLKAFGNDAILVDGKVGGKTADAIREFQSLFKLEMSGNPNMEVLKKLQEIGLVAK